jgi:conjugative relaxase-like TrwC/TraI family protein
MSVLSIGKLAADQAKYYLEHAETRIDAVDSVVTGIEEYYVGAPEARGRWLGTGAERLGLAGDVHAEQLRRVLGGLNPTSAEPLRTSASPVRVAGFDLTFSAPKSVSVVFGIADGEVRGAVRGAHDRAVVEAIGYLERSAAAVRRGAGGLIVEPADGLVAAAFRHRTSRVGDPQLHTHVLVANLGRGLDGRWSALDGRRLYAHARVASFIYQAVLRAELTRSLGLEWLPVRDGIAELAGVPQRVTKAFSRRRAEIEAALGQRGTSSPRAAEAAALATRRPKDRAQAVDRLALEWRERAERLGFGGEEVAWLLGRRRVRDRPITEDQVTKLLLGPVGFTQRRSTFSRRDVIQRFAELLPAELASDAAALEAAADRLLASPEVVPLVAGDSEGEGEVFRRRDGRMVPVDRQDIVYSTVELLAVEQRFVERVRVGLRTGAGAVDTGTVQRAVAARLELSEQQRAMVVRLCLAGERVAAVVGRAGTGKTFALGVARQAWQDAGRPVLGVAVARRAAQELEAGAGIASTSVAALLSDLASGVRPLPAGCVLVIDEAGMVSTRQVATLLEHVEAADGKLVLVGDHRQLPAIEAGGAFRGLVQRGLAIELTDNRRQIEAWERGALEHLREGRAEAAIALYQAHDRVHVAPTEDAARRAIVADWGAAGDPETAVLIARRRDDVADLNTRARQLMRDIGALGREEVRLAGGCFAVGDRAAVKLNDLRLGVHNGDRGRVVELRDDGLALDVAGRVAWLDADFLTARTPRGDPTLVHGYAITGHVAQGVTVDRAFVLADRGLSREWAYTALSRGRRSNHLYLAGAPDDLRAEFAPSDLMTGDPIAGLTAALGRSDDTALALDSGSIADLEHARAVAGANARELDSKLSRWLPGGRRRADTAWTAERRLREQIGVARRTAAEDRHRSLPFVTERDLDTSAARARERIAGRHMRRDIGRDLGR